MSTLNLTERKATTPKVFVDIMTAYDPHQPQMPPRQPHLFYLLLLNGIRISALLIM